MKPRTIIDDARGVLYSIEKKLEELHRILDKERISERPDKQQGNWYSIKCVREGKVISIFEVHHHLYGVDYVLCANGQFVEAGDNHFRNVKRMRFCSLAAAKAKIKELQGRRGNAHNDY